MDGNSTAPVLAPGDHGQDAAPQRHSGRRRRIGLRILAVLGILVLLVAAAIVGYASYLGRTFDEQAQKLAEDEVFPSAQPKAESGDPINILLLGSDSRSGDVDYGADVRGHRSDTIMVMHLNGDRSGAQVMSIPRDLWVPIEGHGSAKINAAMSFGGLSLATQTVGEFIDAPIHHVAILDFQGFQALTDAVGGVDVESEQAFTSGGSTFVEGTNHLNGEDALIFVRERYSFADGDLQLGRNQQAYLRGLVDAIVSADTLSNPRKVAAMVRDFAPYMTVDDGLTASRIAGLAYEMRDVRPGDIQFFSAPIAGAATSADGQAILTVDTDAQELIQEAFDEDTVGEYAAAAETVHL